ncbi:uncharacterized protein PAC_19886 [Phialocephala subalpina]|uniref:Heterokaryon incompatibility domain-containing protein n=1 Tax=Phialocephala subalpina TaxID=576137 RepID=A0A1L7XYH2_9HELO|nr:uncharacterized protein PAC_19886 [Phialocephala subalpina]
MTKFKYEHLKGSAFRLLRLLKGDSDSIQCELFESELPPPEDVGDYAALSYTWGSQSRPCEIMINRSGMEVTKNAYLALRDLRCKEKDRILWIDALCIDQNNKEERGQQVQQMGSIYSKAERVIIWLGEATYDTDYVMRHIQQLEKQLETEGIKYASNGSEVPDKQLEKIWSAIVRSLSDAQKDLLVEGLQSLLHRNWFKRVWILQEAANAQIAEIACGGNSVSASIFARMPFLLGSTPDPHCEPILNIMPGPLRDRSWWAEKPDLYTMLDKFRNSEATDPRDQIYALLGISSDTCDTGFLKADYRKELKDVIFDTISFLLDFNELDSPPCRFFDWGFPEFLGNLNSLANEVLKCAISKEYVALVKLLIARDDVDINVRASDQTPLLWAAENGHEAVVELLLTKDGVDINSKDNAGRTPLLWAAKNGHEAVVKLLLTKGGVNLNTKDKLGRRTPLSLAAENGDEAVVKLLLTKNGVDINSKDYTGRTPLLLAAENGHKAVVKLLLTKDGVDINSKDNAGRMPLSWAVENRHVVIIKLLRKIGARDMSVEDS